MMIGALWEGFQAAAHSFAQAGLRWYHAHTLAQWAEAHLARGNAGDRARAQELLREATAGFDDMGASAYAARIQARLADLAPDSQSPPH
jgi:hypothetical protein